MGDLVMSFPLFAKAGALARDNSPFRKRVARATFVVLSFPLIGTVRHCDLTEVAIGKRKYHISRTNCKAIRAACPKKSPVDLL
jgi:hypothetical protein